MNQELLTVLVTLALLALVALLLARGWSGRRRRQSGLVGEVPAAPADPGELVLGPLTGVYVGSTVAGQWQERLAAPPLGFRAAAALTAYTGGIVLELSGRTVWIARERLVSVRTDSRLANKVIPGEGLLVLRWRLDAPDGGLTEVDSGLRADDKDAYPEWTALTGGAPTTPVHTPTSPTTDSEETM